MCAQGVIGVDVVWQWSKLSGCSLIDEWTPRMCSSHVTFYTHIHGIDLRQSYYPLRKARLTPYRLLPGLQNPIINGWLSLMYRNKWGQHWTNLFDSIPKTT